MSGIQNIVFACICWFAGFWLLAHAALIWEGIVRFKLRTKLAVIVLVFAVLVWILWAPVKDEYRREHQVEFPQVLFAYSQPTDRVRTVFVLNRWPDTIKNVRVALMEHVQRQGPPSASTLVTVGDLSKYDSVPIATVTLTDDPVDAYQINTSTTQGKFMQMEYFRKQPDGSRLPETVITDLAGHTLLKLPNK